MSEEGAFLSGVIEGFYGAPWSQDQRRRLFDLMQSEGLNTYLYAPKDDLKHRALWREPYTPEELETLGGLAESCRERDLHFLYGIAPGLDMSYAEASDREHLKKKVEPLLQAGAGGIALLFDDIPERLSAGDAEVFASFAEAHLEVTRDFWEWLKREWPGVRLLFCPTPYCEAMSGLVDESAYLAEVGRALPREIDVFWTGPDIISERVPEGSIEDVTRVIGRAPILWDNLHANDYDMRRLFLGPLAGRPAGLRDRLRGLLVNPNCQFEANHNVVVTLGDYVRDPAGYDPEAAFARALERWLPSWQTRGKEAVTAEELRFFAECYYLPDRLGPGAQAWLEGAASGGAPDGGAGEEARRRGSGWAVSFARKVTELADRERMHAFYRHAWELKEAALLLELAREKGTPLTPWEFRHPIMRNGVLARVEDLLPMDRAGAYRFRTEREGAEAEAARSIRPARPEDEEALHEVCLRTGDEGEDGSAIYEDPKIIGIIYATPYLHLEPSLAYVLQDEEGVCGYVLGALDSESFYRRVETEWLPRWRSRYPFPERPREDWTPTEQMVAKLYEPETYFPEEARDFPAHLHIDLLARAQGKGEGTRMIFHLLGELVRRGSPGVHLGVGLANRRALRFYRKLGFRELTRRGDCVYLGLPLR